MAAAENTAGNIAADIVADVPPVLPETHAAPTAFPPTSLRGRLQQAFFNIKALDQRQRIAAAAALALGIALIVGTALWNRAPNQAVLFSNFGDQDGGEIINALQQQNVPFSISSDGRSILVPAGVVYETRLRLAAAGLPKGGLVGFELMDTQKLGVSQFNEQVAYQRALEGELARTIQSLASVVAARVHLAMPKQTSFLRDDQKPTASVMVQLRPGRVLDGNQVAGIVHLVSSSVPKMNDSGVSIIDQDGNLLTGEEQARRSELDPAQLRYIEEIETGLIRRVENILTPMYGKDNFRAQVTADIDFNKVEQTAETYRPNPAPEQAIRSQQTNEQQNRDEGPQGVPGALTNQPPVPATAPITIPPVPPQGSVQKTLSNNRSAVINYELDRTIQHVKQSLGQVKRLSVAVVINHRAMQMPTGEAQPMPISDDEITRITSLVRDAVGYNATRGDTISVIGSPFAEIAAERQVPVWKDPQMIALGFEGGKYLGLLILFLFVYFGIIRPLLRTVAPPPKPEEPSSAKARKGRRTDREEEEMEEGAEGTEKGAKDAEMEETVELSEAALRNNTFEARLERIRQIARENPKGIAELLNHWLGVNEEGAHK
ncbi:MAG: flagellar M-ring protein FliF [Betaproteobacteria bacterium]|nr:flagellar M-ring protein FliF [Betaproteobacteria bacterium]